MPARSLRPLALLALLALIALPAPPSSAATFDDEQRHLRIGLGYANLDRGTAYSIDLDSADGPALDVAIGWMRSRVFEGGLQLSYLDLEIGGGAPDAGESLTGPVYGAFLAAHVPTAGRVSPYGVVSVLLFGGDLGSPYEYGYGLGAGVRVVTRSRWGFDARLEYQNFNGDLDPDDVSAGTPGRDYAPDGDVLRFSAGALVRF